MKNAIRFACIFVGIVLNVANAETPIQEQKSATEVVKKMYSYSMNIFEAAEFEGKHMPDKQCALIESFFSKDLIQRKQKNQGCHIGGIFIRYPGFSGADFDVYGGTGQMPRIKLGVPKIAGDEVSISAVSEFGKTIYFLTKTEKGWRVENALYYESIPTEANVCHGEFLKDPTPAQLKYRPDCKDY